MKIIINEQLLKEDKKIKMAILEKKVGNFSLEMIEVKTEKERVREKFKSLLRPETIEIISNIENYTNSLVCQICNQEILDTRKMNFFHLHAEDYKQYITFHFICALRPGTADDFNEIAGEFDYIYSRRQREEK